MWVSSLLETTWECVALEQQRTRPWLFVFWLLCPYHRFALPCRVWSCDGQKVWAGPRDSLSGAKKGRTGDSVLFCGNNVNIVCPCPLHIQASDLASEIYSNMQIWVFIVNFSLMFLMRKRDWLGVSRSKNHNQSFARFLEPCLKCLSFATSLDNPLFYCLALKLWSTLTLSAAFPPFFLSLGDFG